jgi:GNAT superfamily N-acetyltransferase
MHCTPIDLQICDAGRIADHLLRLSPEDRSLRFSSGVVTDQTICAYAGRIRFGNDLVLGLVSQRGQVFGLAHGCVFRQHGQLHIEAAFSVDAAWRGVGLGKALMDALRLRASERAGERVALIGMCAARNWPMRRVFESAGLTLRREDDDMHAHAWVFPCRSTNSPAASRQGARSHLCASWP